MTQKAFFNRESPIVKFLEASGLLFSILFYWRTLPHVDLTVALYSFVFVIYCFIRVCDLKKWYSDDDRPRERKGIEVHLRKALVPSSYILAITSVIAFLGIPYFSTLVVVLAVVLMLVIAPVNGILIYFHCHDKETLPINYFSSNQYLGKDTTLSPSPSSGLLFTDYSFRLPGQAKPDPVNARSL